MNYRIHEYKDLELDPEEVYIDSFHEIFKINITEDVKYINFNSKTYFPQAHIKYIPSKNQIFICSLDRYMSLVTLKHGSESYNVFQITEFEKKSITINEIEIH